MISPSHSIKARRYTKITHSLFRYWTSTVESEFLTECGDYIDRKIEANSEIYKPKKKKNETSIRAKP